MKTEYIKPDQQTVFFHADAGLCETSSHGGSSSDYNEDDDDIFGD